MIKLTQYSLAMMLSASLLAGCVYNHPEPKEMKEELNQAMVDATKLEIPEEVLNDLNPDNPVAGNYQASQMHRVSVAANNVSATEFFGSLISDAHVSLVLHPEVSGDISINMDNVTLEEVFDALQRMYGYRVEKQGDVYYVYPAGVHTVTLPINYILLKRESETKISITNNTVSNSDSNDDSNSSSSSSSSNSDDDDNNESTSGTDLSTTSSSDFWAELQETLSGIIGTGEGRFVRVNPQAANITVRGTPDEIQAVRHFLETTENSLRRQVIIEAKLLEVTLNENYAQGIDWTILFNGGQNYKEMGSATPWAGGQLDSIYSIIGGGFKLNLNDNKYAGFIRLLKTQGDVTTLSSPRLTALNNQKAVMKVGTDTYYLTSISNDSSATSNAETNILTSNYEFEPFFSGVSLDVLPQISEDGKILLHIHPAVIEVQEDKKQLTINGEIQEYPFAMSTVREADTIVEAKSGDVIVIGGLMRHEKGDLESKVPLLGDIPYLGELFTNKQKYDTKSELVILLRPVVVGGDTWREELKKSVDLLEKWYPSEDYTSQQGQTTNVVDPTGIGVK